MKKEPKKKEEKKKKKKKSKKKTALSPSVSYIPSSTHKTKYLLVLDSHYENNWAALFGGRTLLDGSVVEVKQGKWSDILVAAATDAKSSVFVKPNPSCTDPGTGSFQPDFLLIRQLCRGLNTDTDYRNELYGLIVADIPSVNSTMSALLNGERAIVFAALNSIKKRLGSKKFPLVDLDFYSRYNAVTIQPRGYPVVIKTGSAEDLFVAGYGKVKADSFEQVRDITSMVAMHKDYLTIEKYYEREYDIRIQKIGPHLRAYKRLSTNWKGNVGTPIAVDPIEITDEFKLWAEEASKLFGGMDILTVDAIRTKDGKHYILEINDSASGFLKKYEKEDMEHVRDLVLQRMNETLCASGK